METNNKNSVQITIFSIDNCPFCKKAKALLKEKNHEYYEINITSYPSKRTDMIQLSDRLTVPQIFIQNEHIGGAQDLENLSQTGILDEIIQSNSQNLQELDPKLQIGKNLQPIKPFDVSTLDNPMEHEILEIQGKQYTHWEIRDILIKEVDIQDRSYHFKTYKSCFIGSELVDFLLRKFQLKSRDESVSLGQKLLSLGFFSHVVKEHDFKDEYLFYRLYGNENNSILNRFKKYPEGKKLTIDPFHLIKGIKQKFHQIKNFYIDEKDGLVDYTLLKNHKDWNNFQESFSDLQLVDLDLMNENQLLAFTINVYNTIIPIVYAIIGVPKTGFQRYKFFDNYKVDIGGQLYSFNDLEHGLLRGNKKSPGHFSKPFSKDTDPRKKFVLQSLDNRIHFALNCGAKSCPPVKNFTPEAVREELRINTQAFLEDESNVSINIQNNYVLLSRILDWYSTDFGKDDKEKLNFICDNLRGQKQKNLRKLLDEGKPKIKLFDYDWGNDSK